jgi:hypothetical protein
MLSAMNFPIDAQCGAAPRTHMYAETTTGVLGEFMDIAVPISTTRSWRQRRWM